MAREVITDHHHDDDDDDNDVDDMMIMMSIMLRIICHLYKHHDDHAMAKNKAICYPKFLNQLKIPPMFFT